MEIIQIKLNKVKNVKELESQVKEAMLGYTTTKNENKKAKSVDLEQDGFMKLTNKKDVF